MYEVDKKTILWKAVWSEAQPAGCSPRPTKHHLVGSPSSGKPSGGRPDLREDRLHLQTIIWWEPHPVGSPSDARSISLQNH